MTEPKVLAIVPAAGQSRRLGRPKQLIDYQGKTLLARSVECARSVCSDVLVVTGAGRERVLAALAPSTPTTHNPDWRTGLGTSIACATAYAAGGDYDAVLVVLPDQPLVASDDLERLLAAYRAHPGHVVCSAYDGIRGVPAILPRRLFDKLLALTGDHGARDLIAAERDVQTVALETAAFDIDTPADLEKLPR